MACARATHDKSRQHSNTGGVQVMSPIPSWGATGSFFMGVAPSRLRGQEALVGRGLLVHGCYEISTWMLWNWYMDAMKLEHGRYEIGTWMLWDWNMDAMTLELGCYEIGTCPSLHAFPTHFAPCVWEVRLLHANVLLLIVPNSHSMTWCQHLEAGSGIYSEGADRCYRSGPTVRYLQL